MTRLEEIFEELGLTQYLDSFLEQGFDTWETCLDIRESDFDALQVKLGHRRKLERRIAAYRGVDNRQALPPNRAVSPSAEADESNQKVDTPKPEGKDGSNTNLQPTGKRKYRRHAKPDENAPERPPSAYVIFSNKMREDLKGRSLSFTEIAKLVGENWQTLNPAEKEPYEQQAFAAKEKYTIKLAEYRQTENYKIYSEYLADFKAKQQYQLENSQDNNHESSKRPRLDALPTHSSTSTVNSNSSSAYRSEEIVMQVPAGAKGRIHSVGHVQQGWMPPQDTMMQQTALPPISGQSGGIVLARRDSTGPGAPSISWREQQKPIEMPIHGFARQLDQRPLHSSNYGAADSPVGYGHRFASQQSSIGGFTPPLLSSDSTNSTVKSSISSGSGDSRINQALYYAPRAPLDDPSRNLPSLPIQSMFGGSKLPGSFEGQLPPIRHASLSPPSSMNVPYQSGLGTEYQSGPASHPRAPSFPVNRLPPVTHHNHPTLYRHGSSADDNVGPLDPIRALIDAGEIINKQGHQQKTQLQHQANEPPHEHHAHHHHQQRQ